jgi:phosphoglycolate phosphatase
MIELLIFDLDGTLIDSKLDLADSVNATRRHLGKPPLDIEVISTYVGSGAPVLIRRAMGPDAGEGEIHDALEFFLEHYREHSLDRTQLYPGVGQALERLRLAGSRLAILTNKPAGMSRTILQGLGVAGYFFQVYGGNSFEFKKPNPAGVKALMREAGATLAGTVMVGDSAVDIQTARNAGVRACGVTYGFAPESLRDPLPDLLVERIEQLVDWVLAN